MSQIGQTYYRIPGDYTSDSGTVSYISNITDTALYSDVLKAIGASQLTKVGIQAPPGTQMVLNQIKYVMIGRTGIYELDEDIAITELYFIRPKTYIEDEEATANNKEQGQAIMDAAEQAFAIADVSTPEKKNEALKAYYESYSEGYALYTTIEYTSTDGDLENVIIDYIYE